MSELEPDYVLRKKDKFSLRWWLIRKLIGQHPVIANWTIRESTVLHHSGKHGSMICGNMIDGDAAILCIQVDAGVAAA